MRKLSVLLMCVVSAWLVGHGGLAQEPNAGIIFFQHRQFKIPFNYKNTNVAQVRLYVSSDQGQNWQFTATAAPEEQFFRFNTPRDGFYWFAGQTVDATGKLEPPSVDQLKPNLKVIVDTVPPVAQVQALPPRLGEVGVTWTVRDENFDVSLPDAVQLFYRIQGGVTWVPVPLPPGSAQHYWNPQTNAPLDVRLLAKDRAGNVGEDKTVVRLGHAPTPSYVNPAKSDPVIDIERKFVSSKEISLSYDLKDVGPSGVSSVELWYTIHKGRAWTKLNEYTVKNTDGGAQKLTFTVPDEDIYGFTLVAKSGVGLGEQPPKLGDRPQFWIEVDVTKPFVQITNVTVGTGAEKGKLTVQWSAYDKNLGAQPIRLSYSEDKAGPWTTFAEKQANASRFAWAMKDPTLPYQFYIRVEATDRAGNIGEAITQEKVRVDLSMPKATIRDIEPGGK